MHAPTTKPQTHSRHLGIDACFCHANNVPCLDIFVAIKGCSTCNYKKKNNTTLQADDEKSYDRVLLWRKVFCVPGHHLIIIVY